MKYIDADKLIAEIRRIVEEETPISKGADYYHGVADAADKLLSFITSLQQEKPAVALKQAYPYVPGWRLNEDNNKPAINHSILMLTKHGVAEGEWNGNEWTQYRWSCKVKDTEVLYWIHLEDLTQLEKEGDSLQQEQPECIEKTARISPGILSNFGTSTYVLGVDLSQEEMAKMAPFGFNSGNIKIKIVCE